MPVKPTSKEGGFNLNVKFRAETVIPTSCLPPVCLFH